MTYKITLLYKLRHLFVAISPERQSEIKGQEEADR